MSKRKRKEKIVSESTQLSITKSMLPKIKLEPIEKKIKLEFEEKEKGEK